MEVDVCHIICNVQNCNIIINQAAIGWSLNWLTNNMQQLKVAKSAPIITWIRVLQEYKWLCQGIYYTEPLRPTSSSISSIYSKTVSGYEK